MKGHIHSPSVDWTFASLIMTDAAHHSIEVTFSTLTILMSSNGLSFLSVLALSMARTTSAPFTTCSPSRSNHQPEIDGTRKSGLRMQLGSVFDALCQGDHSAAGPARESERASNTRSTARMTMVSRQLQEGANLPGQIQYACCPARA